MECDQGERFGVGRVEGGGWVGRVEGGDLVGR